MDSENKNAAKYRPVYHFLPEKNWMNDPNGVCWYQGEYHLFYQYNPTGDQWGNLHWGHAVSRDCVNWEHLPLGLYPSGEKGEIHCFSGCCNVDGEFPVIYYTSVGEQEAGRDCRDGAEQWCAVSHDGMRTWEKYENNPVLTKEMHGEIVVKDWRDPFVWKEADGWYMVLGAEVDKKGTVLLYYSPDQFHWKFRHILLQTEKEEENIWECPNYFKLKDKSVLVVSPNGMPRYWVGREKADHCFVPEREGIIDHSGWEGFYAPNSFEDPQGRRIMIGWLTENGRKDLEIPGWQGVQSIPRVLTVEEDGLHMEPLKELEMLRGACEAAEHLQVKDGFKAETKGKALEICLAFEKEKVKKGMCLEVFASPDREERTQICWDAGKDEIAVVRSASNRTGKTSDISLSCKVPQTAEGKVSLRIFSDHSTLEVFVNEREAVSTRIYPDREDSECVFLYAEDGEIEELRIYQMKEQKTK